MTILALVLFSTPSQLLRTAAHAQTPEGASITVTEAQRQVFLAVTAANATLEATKRQHDRKLRRKLFEIEDLHAQILELQAQGTAKNEQLEELRNTLVRDQESFVAELAARDEV